jgi:hypothetical protein
MLNERPSVGRLSPMAFLHTANFGTAQSISIQPFRDEFYANRHKLFYKRNAFIGGLLK